MSLWQRVYQEHKRVMLPLAVALVANAVILVLAVFPLRAGVARSEMTVVDAARELGEARLAERRAGDARTSKQHADTDLQKFYGEVLPRDFSTSQKAMNLWLIEAAREAGLVFRGSQFDLGEIRDSRLSRAFSRVTLQGRYPNIRRFLYEVETAEEFIIVDRVELAQPSEQVGTNGLLEVSLVVSTYFVTPPKS